MANLSNAYALLIGVGDAELDTVDDAIDVGKILTDKTLAGYETENVILITGEKATRKGILSAFDELIAKTNEDSSVFLYYSGHGGFQLDSYFIQPYGMHNDMNEEEFINAWVSAGELQEKINALSSKRLIFFLDCCHAEGMTQGVRNTQEKSLLKGKKGLVSKSGNTGFKNADGLATKIDNERGIAIISSCRGDQESFQIPDEKNSLFTQCLLEALTGQHKKTFEEPYIRISEVSGYLQREVPKRIKPWEVEQNPYVNLQQYDDFVLSYVPKEIRERLEIEEESDQDKPAQKKFNEVVTTFRETPKATNLLLFVHGFSGEAADTFGQIPEFLAKDSKMDGWDMKPLGYSQHVNPELGKDIWAGIDDIEKITDYLTTSITYKFDKYDRVAVVAHSLGGLIAQKAILRLKPDALNKISHLIMLGTPSMGIEAEVLNKSWNDKYSSMSSDGPFIKNLRSKWSEKFKEGYPFELKVAFALSDQYVTSKSCVGPFSEEERVTVSGSHLAMVKPDDVHNDTYNLILNTLTDVEFYNLYTNREEINLALGHYETVKKELLPKINELDTNGLKQLIFSLEGLDEKELVLEILNEHPLAKDNSEIIGLLAGRHKRKYLKTYSKNEGDAAMNYYQKGLDLSIKAENKKQVYYHAINLAFLSVVKENNETKMEKYAIQALEAAEQTRDGLWKFATIAEASMYLDDMAKAKEYYQKAADMAEIREKISMHTNAYAGYCSLIGVRNDEDPFVVFLKQNFLA